MFDVVGSSRWSTTCAMVTKVVIVILKFLIALKQVCACVHVCVCVWVCVRACVHAEYHLPNVQFRLIEKINMKRRNKDGSIEDRKQRRREEHFGRGKMQQKAAAAATCLNLNLSHSKYILFTPTLQDFSLGLSL